MDNAQHPRIYMEQTLAFSFNKNTTKLLPLILQFQNRKKIRFAKILIATFYTKNK
jgi:hypothetical protein